MVVEEISSENISASEVTIVKQVSEVGENIIDEIVSGFTGFTLDNEKVVFDSISKINFQRSRASYEAILNFSRI